MTGPGVEAAADRAELPPSVLLRSDLLRVGSTGLRTRRLRAALSALGIAIGIASLVAVLGISQSSQAALLAQLDALGTNLLQVKPGQGIGFGDSELPATVEQQLRQVPAVQAVSSVGDVDARVLRSDLADPSATGGITVKAARTDLLEALGGRVARGSFLDAATAQHPVVVLGAVAAERLGVLDLEGSPAVSIDGRSFAVLGVLDPLPLTPDVDRAALVGYPAAEAYLDDEGSPSTVYLRADPDDVPAVRDVLPRQADPANPENVDVSRPSDALAARAAAEGAYTSLLLGLGAVALLVGGVGIANVMVISVLERRGEIGLRRALGATRRHVRTQFLAESLLLAAAGGAGGAVLGVLVTLAWSLAEGEPVVLPVGGVLLGVSAAVAVGALAGLYPAARAARLAPTEALRSA